MGSGDNVKVDESARLPADSVDPLITALADRYRVEQEIGSGGMATVYLAEDLRHHRKVAVKLLRPELTVSLGAQRFLREIDVVAQLQHPNVLPLLDSGVAGSYLYYVMPYVEGPSLRARLSNQGPLPIPDAVRTLTEIVDALAEAHRHGIVHRDVKPDNVLLTGRHAMVTDFGVAKAVNDAGGTQIVTSVGVALGTPAYMAPEQAAGDPHLDHRVDIYAVGVLAYEMLTGSPPFSGTSPRVLAAHMSEEPEPPRTRRAEIPAELEAVVLKCLQKDPAQRWQSADELLAQLETFATTSGVITPLPRAGVRALATVVRRPKIAIPLVAVLAALVAIGVWAWVRDSRLRWARGAALPAITRMVDSGNYYGAFIIARRARQYIPDDPVLQAHWRTVAVPLSIRTAPPGANVYLKDYLLASDAAEWQSVGTTPLHRVQIPIGRLRWRVTKEGYDDVNVATAWAGALFDTVSFTLHQRGTAPPGMVFARGGPFRGTRMDDYWIDKYEVTNRQFQQFVNAGGYQKREFWKQPFKDNGGVLAWEQAMEKFRDVSGRPGPSTWEFGRYPEGQADFPVSGVSWYEAAAYAEFVGKSLPTVAHVVRARAFGPQLQLLEGMTRLGNIGRKGPARVGSNSAISLAGAYDMVGNVREWCWNEVGDQRCSLGGSWDDPDYMALLTPHAMPPFERSRIQGFRLAKFPSPMPEQLFAPVPEGRDYRTVKPVSDEVFRVYKQVYGYDRTPLKATAETIDDGAPHWRQEKITFDAAYGDERMITYLFLPKNASPPYQTVVYFPGGGAFFMRSISFLDEAFSNFVVQSGRALLFPIYKDTYERRMHGITRGPNFFRDLGIHWYKDFSRSIDYLQTRPDIDRDKIAFYGFSHGPSWGVIFMALDDRVKTGVFLSGGLSPNLQLPESDAINFAPRVRQPVLMINGEDDSFYPVETSQRPLFNRLATPERDKRHVIVPDAGHVVHRQSFMKEILDWLDRYLGPVGAMRGVK